MSFSIRSLIFLCISVSIVLTGPKVKKRTYIDYDIQSKFGEYEKVESYRIETSYMFDDRGNMIAEESYHNGEFYKNRILTYNEFDSILTQSFFDVDGNPGMGPDGYYFFDTEYDYQGRKIKKSYYNQNGEKVAPYNLNFHAFVNEYQDNQDKQSYYDINGDLIDAVNGYAVLYSEYNDMGDRVSSSTYSSDGSPFMEKDGYFRWIGKYDHNSNLIGSFHYDINGELVNQGDEGYAVVESKYDYNNNLIENRFFDKHGDLLQYKSVIKNKFENNNFVEQKQYNSNNELAVQDAPYWLEEVYFNIYKQKFDYNGNSIRELFFYDDMLVCSVSKEYNEYDAMLSFSLFTYSEKFGELLRDLVSYRTWQYEYY